MNIFRSATVSWKTSLLGVLVFAESVFQNLIYVFDENPETLADWNLVVIAGTAMIAMLFAKDADKTTEDHSPVRTFKSNLP